MAPASSSDDPRTIELTSRAFAFLWGGAHFLHAWHKGGPDLAAPLTDPALLSVLVVAAAVLLRPSSVDRLAALAATQLVVFAYQLPFVANHWTIAAFVNAGILTSYIALRGWKSGERDPITHFAPYARAVFLIAYGAAAVAKLNTTFLDPDHSCAVWLIVPIGEWLGFEVPAGPAIRWVIIAMVASIELAVPILLIIRRTRVFGIGLAAVFHLGLASTPVVLVMDFTAFVLALLLLFVPADLGVRLRSEAKGFAKRRPRLTRRLAMAWPVGKRVLILSLLALAIVRARFIGPEVWIVLTWTVFLVYGVLVTFAGLVIIVSSRGRTDRPAMPGTGSGYPWGHRILLVLILLNVASPYIGLKTTSSFTMFSNLRTESGLSNHLFLPTPRVFGYQDHVVEVIESSHPYLDQLAGEGQMITRHELRRILQRNPEASLVYFLDGETRRLAAASEDEMLITLSFLERKLVHHRTVTANGHPVCQP